MYLSKNDEIYCKPLRTTTVRMRRVLIQRLRGHKRVSGLMKVNCVFVVSQLCNNFIFRIKNKAPINPVPMYRMLQGVNNTQSSKLAVYEKKANTPAQPIDELKKQGKKSGFDDLTVDFKKIDFEFKTSLINFNIEKSGALTPEFKKAFKHLISNPSYANERHLDKKDEFGKVVLRFLHEAEAFCQNTLQKLNDIKTRLN